MQKLYSCGGEIYLIYNDTAQSLVLWGYFISSECFSSEATEPFDLIRLIRWGWVATWLGTLPCGDYSIRRYKAEQKMYLLLLRLQANHRVYLRYCLAGGIVGIWLAFKAWAKTWIKHAETESEMLDGLNPEDRINFCENVNKKAKRWPTACGFVVSFCLPRNIFLMIRWPDLGSTSDLLNFSPAHSQPVPITSAWMEILLGRASSGVKAVKNGLLSCLV